MCEMEGTLRCALTDDGEHVVWPTFDWKEDLNLKVFGFLQTCFSISCQNLQCHLPEPVRKRDKKDGRIPTLTY